MSDIQFRIYGKLREILKKYKVKREDLNGEKLIELNRKENLRLDLGQIWRFEIQMRKVGLSHAINGNYSPCDGFQCIGGFKDLSCIHYKYINFLHAVKNIGLQNALKILPKKVRRQYLNFLDTFGIPLVHPKDIWQQHFINDFEKIRLELKKIMTLLKCFQ